MIFTAAVCLSIATSRDNDSEVLAQNGEVGASSEIESRLRAEGHEEAAAEYQQLNELFHWAIENSDPESLSETAAKVGKYTKEELEALKERQAAVREALDQFKNMPTEAEIMQDIISLLNNESTNAVQHENALLYLQELVEPIDNANDLYGMGGIHAVLRKLHSPQENVRKAAAWVLGTAASNNPAVQGQLLGEGALEVLLAMTSSDTGGAQQKALYALAAIVRNNPDTRMAFYKAEGTAVLQKLLADSHLPLGMHKKALLLVGDLASDEKQALGVGVGLNHEALVRSLLRFVQHRDLDTKEKTLRTIELLMDTQPEIRQMLMVTLSAGHILRDAVLQLEDPMYSDEDSEYVQEISSIILRIAARLADNGKEEL